MTDHAMVPAQKDKMFVKLKGVPSTIACIFAILKWCRDSHRCCNRTGEADTVAVRISKPNVQPVVVCWRQGGTVRR